MILPYIPVTRRERALSLLCASRRTSLLMSNRASVFLMQYLYFVLINKHQQHRQKFGVSHSTSVPPDYNEPS